MERWAYSGARKGTVSAPELIDLANAKKVQSRVGVASSGCDHGIDVNLRSMPIAIFAVTVVGFSQSQPQFEVASVKDAPPLTPDRVAAGKLGVRISGASVSVGYKTLRDLLGIAFRLKTPLQIVGPGFMSERRFDILAKFPEGATRAQLPEMLQSLLRERFALVVHHESRPISVFALTAQKEVFLKKQEAKENTGPAVSKNPSGTLQINLDDGGQRHITPLESVATFVESLAGILGELVLDETQLEGKYRFWMDFPSARDFGLVDPVTQAYRYLSEQGLKLESKKVPMDVVVVDSVSKTPTGN